MLDDYAGFCKGVKNDPTPEGATGTLEFVQAEMTTPGSWCESFTGVDSVMHLQAWNPYPEATWEDARLSMDITNNAIAAAQQNGVRRFIYASSNHVFGRYWREGATLSESGKPITVDTLPNPGTQFRVPSYDCDATPYAAAKLAGECALRAATASTPGFSGCVSCAAPSEHAGACPVMQSNCSCGAPRRSICISGSCDTAADAVQNFIAHWLVSTR